MLQAVQTAFCFFLACGYLPLRARLLWMAADEKNVSRLLSHKLFAYVMRMLTGTEDSLAGDSLTELFSVAS